MIKRAKTRKMFEKEYRVFEKDGKFYYEGKRGIHPVSITTSTTKHKYGKDRQYKLINLTSFKTGKQDSFTYHCFLYAWYKGDVPIGYDVDHIDGNSLNNDLDNLQLLTRKENIAKRTGNVNQFGGKKPVYCLELDKTFSSMCEAARYFNVTDSYIVQCCKGQVKTVCGYHLSYANASDSETKYIVKEN